MLHSYYFVIMNKIVPPFPRMGVDPISLKELLVAWQPVTLEFVRGHNVVHGSLSGFSQHEAKAERSNVWRLLSF